MHLELEAIIGVDGFTLLPTVLLRQRPQRGEGVLTRDALVDVNGVVHAGTDLAEVVPHPTAAVAVDLDNGAHDYPLGIFLGLRCVMRPQPQHCLALVCLPSFTA